MRQQRIQAQGVGHMDCRNIGEILRPWPSDMPLFLNDRAEENPSVPRAGRH